MDVLENPDNIQQEDTLSIISPAKTSSCNFIPDNDDKPTIELSKLYITSKEFEKNLRAHHQQSSARVF